MQYALPTFFLYLIIFNAIEYPIFGIILLSIIVVFCFWIFHITRITDKNKNPTTGVNQDSYDEAFKLAEERRKETKRKILESNNKTINLACQKILKRSLKKILK